MKQVNTWALPSRKIVKTAVKDLCRKYLPKPPRVIARFNGSGTQNTPSFTVPAQWHLSWAYLGLLWRERQLRCDRSQHRWH